MSNFKQKLEAWKEEALCRWLSQRYNIPGGFKRIYHYHIRKSGGTSLNYLFHSLVTSQPWTSAYAQLSQVPNHRIVRDNLVFVGWNGRLINKGYYFFAFSHMPSHWVRLKPRTFTLTCFRDPCRRVISHYNMLMEWKTNNVPHVDIKNEGDWLGNSFEDFIERIPREHLQRQLFMFSEKLDMNEALEKIQRLSHVMFTEDFAEGIKRLNRKLGLSLEPIHTRKAGYKTEIKDATLNHLRIKLAPEYELLDRVKKLIAEGKVAGN